MNAMVLDAFAREMLKLASTWGMKLNTAPQVPSATAGAGTMSATTMSPTGQRVAGLPKLSLPTPNRKATPNPSLARSTMSQFSAGVRPAGSTGRG
jgi:hypothetical protein